MRKFLFICLLLSAFSVKGHAQLSTTANVSGKEPFTDNLEMSKDMTGTDLIVKISFNEGANTLTVRLVSYRGLFVFRDDVYYGNVVSWCHLRPEKFPYQVSHDPKDSYYVTDAIRKAIKGPLGKQLFHRWVQCDGLQPVKTEYKMVNDVIEQTFDIQDKRSVVSLTLRDIFLMDPGKQEGKYSIVYWKDLNKKYDVAIMRDACFGKEEEINASKQALDGIKAAYDSLKVRYGSGVVQNRESYAIFTELKNGLMAQYQKRSSESLCDCIYENTENYNLYVDSLSRLQVKMPEAARQVVVRGVNAQSLLSIAQKIDISVSRWLASSNSKERKDIEKECRRLIRSGNDDIDSKGVYTQEQKDARTAFKQAEAYFNKTCGQ
ncbi:MAG: hypothetical protein J6Y32_06905 [Bacteroidales bacterium]|nr:hypothetical protein [Bacteroidales bacterium]